MCYEWDKLPPLGTAKRLGQTINCLTASTPTRQLRSATSHRNRATLIRNLPDMRAVYLNVLTYVKKNGDSAVNLFILF